MAQFVMAGKMKPASVADAMNLKKMTEERLRLQAPLPPQCFYFGSPKPWTGDVVPEREMLPQGLIPTGRLQDFLYALGYTPWLGVYAAYVKP